MTRDEWLKQIQANHSDWQTVLIFADWLEEQGEELEAEQWRFAVQWRLGVNFHSMQFAVNALRATPSAGEKDTFTRRYEREWCQENSVRFIPFFPRTLADLEAIRSGAIDNAATTR